MEPCLSVPDNVKKEILTTFVKNVEYTKRKRKIIHNIDDLENECDEVQQVTSKKKGKSTTLDAFVKRGKCASASGRTQTTTNQMLKRELREECCQQIARFFYACAVPFNYVRHSDFTKMLELVGKYGCRLKPLTYHEIKVKYLKKEVTCTMELLGGV